MITIHNYNIPDKAKIYLIFLFFYPLIYLSLHWFQAMLQFFLITKRFLFIIQSVLQIGFLRALPPPHLKKSDENFVCDHSVSILVMHGFNLLSRIWFLFHTGNVLCYNFVLHCGPSEHIISQTAMLTKYNPNCRMPPNVYSCQIQFKLTRYFQRKLKKEKCTNE